MDILQVCMKSAISFRPQLINNERALTPIMDSIRRFHKGG